MRTLASAWEHAACLLYLMARYGLAWLYVSYEANKHADPPQCIHILSAEDRKPRPVQSRGHVSTWAKEERPAEEGSVSLACANARSLKSIFDKCARSSRRFFSEVVLYSLLSSKHDVFREAENDNAIWRNVHHIILPTTSPYLSAASLKNNKIPVIW